MMKISSFLFFLIPIVATIFVFFGLTMEIKSYSTATRSFDNIFEIDKIAHIFIFFSLSFFYHWSFSAFIRRKKVAITTQKYKYIVLIIVGFLFAGFTEWAQDHFTATRRGDFFDFLSDLLGIILYIFFYRFFISISST